MLIFSVAPGDLAYLQQLIDEEGFQREVLAQHRLIRDGWQIDYFTFRLTV
jgi:release factor glutamine methyltransferase